MKATIHFNRVNNKFEVIKQGVVIGTYSAYTMALARLQHENN